MSAPALLRRAEIPDPERFLTTAEVEIEGRMPWSSNGTFLVTLHGSTPDNPSASQRAIYKPVKGERPLWDFPPGLHRRERAMYVLSEYLGLSVVPPTVIRDGPFGEGSFQWFVEADHSQHYFTIYDQHVGLHPQLRQIAVLDLVANNTDRKSGHCLIAGERVWAIDHGLCFSAEFKLRTVVWEFAGQPIDDDLLHQLATLATTVPDDLTDLLEPDEVEALVDRVGRVLGGRVLPDDPTGTRYPWPLV